MSALEVVAARELLAGARVARLATLAGDGSPRLVPICFAVDDEVVYHAIDHKPKAARRPARVARLRADPRATVLADHYEDDDWDALWWVRADGTARVLEDLAGPEATRALELLSRRYTQYRAHPPRGPVIALDIERLTGWTARD